MLRDKMEIIIFEENLFSVYCEAKFRFSQTKGGGGG